MEAMKQNISNLDCRLNAKSTTIIYVGLQTDIIRLLTDLLYFTSLTLSGLNYYELLATCSKYSTDVSHMSENIITQSKIWNMFSYTV